jgi:hypothetical protein
MDKWAKYMQIYNLYRMWMEPTVRCMTMNKCNSHCLDGMMYVEQFLYQNNHLPNVYPNMWGCPIHGNYKIISLNHPSTTMYCNEWMKYVAQNKLEKAPCTEHCKYIHIPQTFHVNNQIQHHFEPIFFCPIHYSVHFCIGDIRACNKCPSCANHQPCPFCCLTDANSDACFITGVDISNISGNDHKTHAIAQNHAAANNHTDFRDGLDMQTTIRKINQMIHVNLNTWIVRASKNTEPLAQSTETLFSKWMNRYCYVCTKPDGERVYLYPNILAIEYIYEQQRVNHQPFVHYESLDTMLFYLWSLLFYHITEIFGWKFMIALVAHLNAEQGLCMQNIKIDLNPAYSFLLQRLHHTPAPKKTKRTNILVVSQTLCSYIAALNVHQQRNIYNALKDEKLNLFVYQ